ncbi:hypothetical protein ELQ35_08805 [Peribacillus cavernae]|uniref:Uncharacterized protein n=1 Tax=Peribacillus cavernae TaxID=1674310 RepID=A0A3S0UFJ8_9BACI|nr:hypothetical protein [Peribacillus cavernae]MDQ0217096.1 hypothetical protein [Peribacillus cavernae]RUQ30427.1 hypothetical protein ELQ35_08805 [Peribacillus cavernae]
MQSANTIRPQFQSYQSQTEKLLTGQIIHGKINKIYPNQTAEVQIGNQKIFAVLDAPLKTGERYWLQVQPGEGKLHLKVLDPVAGNGSYPLKGASEQLLAHLTVTPGRESIELANFLLKNQLPITKESFESSLHWLRTSNSLGSSLASIKTMHDMNLPFVDDVFQALHSLEQDETFYSKLARLYSQMNGYGTDTKLSQQLKGLLKIIVPGQHLASTAVDQLLISWLSPKTPAETQKAAFSILQKAGFIPEGISEAEFFEKILIASQQVKNQFPPPLKDGLSLILGYTAAKQTGSPAADTFLTLYNRFISDFGTITEESLQPPKIIDKLVLSGALKGQETVTLTKNLLETLFVFSSEQGDIERRLLHKDSFFSALNESNFRPEQASEKVARYFAERPEAAGLLSDLEKIERQLLKDITAAVEKPVDFTKGPPVAGFVKELIKMLGVNMEHLLANAGGLEAGVANEELLALKPLLLKLLAENQHQSIRDAAEQVINRITAQQLLSQDNGPLQNVFMQIPLALSGFQTDLTLQWSGRKKSDGTIDPEFCRVLFYLDLEQMQQTVIDMQIQNRVLKISVINDDHAKLEQLSHPLTGLLKSNLENMNYKLSSLVFESEANIAAKQTRPTQNPAFQAGNKPYRGVDIRI